MKNFEINKEEHRFMELDKVNLLEDPTRFQIFGEIFLKGRMTATQLLEQLDINRSTLSFHLKKMVEANILHVEINETGRMIKKYLITDEMRKKKILHGDISYEDAIRQLKNISFDFKIASKLFDQKISKLEHKKLIKSDTGSISIGDETIMNGGLIFLDEKNSEDFQKELAVLIKKYKHTNFSITSERTYAFVLGGFPLIEPINVKIVRDKKILE